jgi:hypothetical protein
MSSTETPLNDQPDHASAAQSASTEQFTDPRWKQTIASYTDYADAQAAVDYLADANFPVERVAIVGLDVRTVEKVTGRLTNGIAALRGLAAGAWFGLLLGLLFGIFAPGLGWVAILLISILSGAAWGALFGFLGHLVTGGRRDFASEESIEAGRYEVQVEAAFAPEASRLLAARSTNPPQQ